MSSSRRTAASSGRERNIVHINDTSLDLRVAAYRFRTCFPRLSDLRDRDSRTPKPQRCNTDRNVANPGNYYPDCKVMVPDPLILSLICACSIACSIYMSLPIVSTLFVLPEQSEASLIPLNHRQGLATAWSEHLIQFRPDEDRV